MKTAHPAELQFGIELYSTDFAGVGGRLKTRFEDFQVEEIDETGRVLEIQEWMTEEPLRDISGVRSKNIHFTLQKMGLSTFDVAAILSAELNIPRTRVGYAGLKDKRAVTTQTMSVPAQAAESLKTLKLSRVDIRDVVYVRAQVQIGDLWGNRFTITLKDLEASCADVQESLQVLKEVPLLNYFGVQRFGVLRPQTHLVGKALVNRDFEDAIRIMLTTKSEFDSPELTEARMKLLEELKPDEGILALFPENQYEYAVLKQLIKNPEDHVRAFRKVPPKVQTLFVHSYQSYLFNLTISIRAKQRLSLSVPSPGDFIIQLDAAHSGRDSWLFVTEKTLEERTQQVTEGKYGLAMIVPGYSSKTPPSLQSEIVSKILESENIRFAQFRNTQNKNLDSPGGLHLVSIRIPDLQIECTDDYMGLTFSLRKGSYATIVMREIMKNHPINRV